MDGAPDAQARRPDPADAAEAPPTELAAPGAGMPADASQGQRAAPSAEQGASQAGPGPAPAAASSQAAAGTAGAAEARPGQAATGAAAPSSRPFAGEPEPAASRPPEQAGPGPGQAGASSAQARSAVQAGPGAAGAGSAAEALGKKHYAGPAVRAGAAWRSLGLQPRARTAPCPAVSQTARHPCACFTVPAPRQRQPRHRCACSGGKSPAAACPAAAGSRCKTAPANRAVALTAPCAAQLPPPAYLASTRQILGAGCDCCIIANPSLPQAQLLQKVTYLPALEQTLRQLVQRPNCQAGHQLQRCVCRCCRSWRRPRPLWSTPTGCSRWQRRWRSCRHVRPGVPLKTHGRCCCAPRATARCTAAVCAPRAAHATQQLAVIHALGPGC